MLPSSGLSAVESTSATKKSLNSLHTHSGYSAEKKYIITLNELALLGARIRSVSMAESLASLLHGASQSVWHRSGARAYWYALEVSLGRPSSQASAGSSTSPSQSSSSSLPTTSYAPGLTRWAAVHPPPSTSQQSLVHGP